MAAINIHPYRLVTTTAAGTSTITTDLTVPAGKRIILDVIELKFGTSAANNTVDIQTAKAGSGYANIWPQITTFVYTAVDLASMFPRTIELEATDVLRIIHTRGTSSTCESILYYISRDI